MRKIHIRFQAEPSRKDIDVLIQASERDAEVEALINRISGEEKNIIVAADANGLRVRLTPSQIILITMSGNIARIETGYGYYTLRQTLQNIEHKLADKRFLRISRSELINEEKIIRYDFTVKGELRLELAGGIEVWASRRCIPMVRARMIGKE